MDAQVRKAVLIMNKGRVRPQERGFTLLESLLSILIVGLGIVAMMQLFAAGTEVNSFGNKLSTGVIFAEQVRAETDEIVFDDLLDYDGQTFAGAAGLDNYQVLLTVQSVNPDDLTTYVGADPEMMRVTAAVHFKNDELTQMSWLRSR